MKIRYGISLIPGCLRQPHSGALIGHLAKFWLLLIENIPNKNDTQQNSLPHAFYFNSLWPVVLILWLFKVLIPNRAIHVYLSNSTEPVFPDQQYSIQIPIEKKIQVFARKNLYFYEQNIIELWYQAKFLEKHHDFPKYC